MKPEKIVKVCDEKVLDFEGDLKDAIIDLCKLLGQGFTKIKYHYDYEDKIWKAFKYRKETDKEYEERIKEENKRKKDSLAYEKKLYRQLKKKFEKEMEDVED